MDQWTWASGSDANDRPGVYFTISPNISSPFAPTATPPSSTPTLMEPDNLQASVIVPAVVVPVVGVGAIILGVLLGLRRRKKNKNHNKQVNPISLLSQFDKRLIPYNSVTLDKEIGAGSYGKGMLVI